MMRVPFSVHEAYIEKFMEKGVDEPVLSLLHAATAKARSKTEEIAQLCHRVLVMREGRVVSELSGPAADAEAIVAAALREEVAA